jgi:hypothetical protein
VATPLYIANAVRVNGETFLSIAGHGLTAADQGRTITILGNSEPTLNGSFPMSTIIPPDTIRFLQPGLPELDGMAGGAAAFT